jgi:hypothetical protein
MSALSPYTPWRWAPDLVAPGVVGTLVFAGAHLSFGLSPQERRAPRISLTTAMAGEV